MTTPTKTRTRTRTRTMRRINPRRTFNIALYMRANGRTWTEWEDVEARNRNEAWDKVFIAGFLSRENVNGVAVFGN